MSRERQEITCVARWSCPPLPIRWGEGSRERGSWHRCVRSRFSVRTINHIDYFKSCGVTSNSRSSLGLSESPSNEILLSPTFNGNGPTRNCFPDSSFGTFTDLPLILKLSNLP